MFEKISRLAERAAGKVSVSRRGFLGRLGQAALGAAGALGGLLALSSKARAGQNTLYQCFYQTRLSKKCSAYGLPCDALLNGQYCGGCPSGGSCCQLVSKSIVGTC
jgi:hypothetical protein